MKTLCDVTSPEPRSQVRPNSWNKMKNNHNEHLETRKTPALLSVTVDLLAASDVVVIWRIDETPEDR